MSIRIRPTLRAGDLDRIVAHHARVYGPEYGVNDDFRQHVAATVERAAARGFPTSREAIAIVELDGEHAGSLALTDEAAFRWFVLDPALRGLGLGRSLVEEMLAKAREMGYVQIWLETFSELEAAAHLYREHGFRVVSADTGPRWGRNAITFQRYAVDLRAGGLPRIERQRVFGP